MAQTKLVLLKQLLGPCLRGQTHRILAARPPKISLSYASQYSILELCNRLLPERLPNCSCADAGAAISRTLHGLQSAVLAGAYALCYLIHRRRTMHATRCQFLSAYFWTLVLRSHTDVARPLVRVAPLHWYQVYQLLDPLAERPLVSHAYPLYMLFMYCSYPCAISFPSTPTRTVWTALRTLNSPWTPDANPAVPCRCSQMSISAPLAVPWRPLATQYQSCAFSRRFSNAFLIQHRRSVPSSI